MKNKIKKTNTMIYTIMIICLAVFCAFGGYFIGVRRGLITGEKYLEDAKKEWYESLFPKEPEEEVWDCGEYSDEPDVHMKDGTIHFNFDRALKEEKAKEVVRQLEELFVDEEDVTPEEKDAIERRMEAEEKIINRTLDGGEY